MKQALKKMFSKLEVSSHTEMAMQLSAAEETYNSAASNESPDGQIN